MYSAADIQALAAQLSAPVQALAVQALAVPDIWGTPELPLLFLHRSLWYHRGCHEVLFFPGQHQQ